MTTRFLSALLATVSLSSISLAAPAPADFIISGGTVYTGADVAPTVTDVVIAGDKVVYVGTGAAGRYQAKTTIDAKGKIVAPGFIDGHTHPEPHLESPDPNRRANPLWLYQGATTILTGIDGSGTPDIADLAAKYGKSGIGTNVVPYVGFGAVRERVLNFDDRAPTAAELEQEKALVARAMCQGALGLSAGLFNVPQSFARTEEVIELAKEAATRGGIYDTHQRDEASYSIGLLASTSEVLRIGREAQIPVHFSHIKALGIDVHGKAPEVIQMINAARAQGMDVTANQYPWAASSTRLIVMLMPHWAEAGGRQAMLKRFDDPVQLEKIRTEMRDNLRRRGGPDSILMIASNQEWTGKTLTELGKMWKMEPVDAAIKITKATTGPGLSAVSFNMIEADVTAFMRQPWVSTSSDGGGNHPRTAATYPRKFLKYAKEDKTITVAEFIRSSTGRAADQYRLDRRGYLKDGYFADVVVFDPEAYKPKADYVHGNELAEGVTAVFVNGQLELQDGKLTGKLAGQVILKKPPAGTCS